MFGFLKKAVGSLIDGVKKKLEAKPAEQQESEKQEAWGFEKGTERQEISEIAGPSSSPAAEGAARDEGVPQAEASEAAGVPEAPLGNPLLRAPEEAPGIAQPATAEPPEAEIPERAQDAFSEEPVPAVLPEEAEEGAPAAADIPQLSVEPVALPAEPRSGDATFRTGELAEEALATAEQAQEKGEPVLPPEISGEMSLQNIESAEIAPAVIEPAEAPEAEMLAPALAPPAQHAHPQSARAKKETAPAPSAQKKREVELPAAEKPEAAKKAQPPSVRTVPPVEKKPAAVPRIPVAEVEAVEGPKAATGFFGKLFGGMREAAKTVVKAVQEKTVREEDVTDILWNFQIRLIQANVASEVAEKICESIRKDLVGSKVKRTDDVKGLIVGSLRRSILRIIDTSSEGFLERVSSKKPFLVLFLGFNGTGKTTTIAKVASLLKERGLSCVIAAGDTFRAAAMEQAEFHGDKLGVKVIKQQYGADAAAVVFDAAKYAQANGIDVVLADTAGRQHTNSNLMEELKKIVRVNRPDMKVLVIDSLSGSDTVLQAKNFDAAVDGVIMSKVDVDEKGGAVISVAHTIGKPILFLGMGQGYADLKKFDAREYVEMLLG